MIHPSSSVSATFRSMFGLVIITLLLSLAGIASASADCTIEQGAWKRGVADENNFRHINTVPKDDCYKESYSGFDNWGGVKQLTSPKSGKLRCGYLAIQGSHNGWAYYVYDVVQRDDLLNPDSLAPVAMSLPPIPSLPCQEQFTVEIQDGEGSTTTALYFVRVDQKAVGSGITPECSPAGYSCASTPNCCAGLTCQLRNGVGTCH